MLEEPVAVKYAVRRDTTTNWTKFNPILADGEIAVDLTVKNFKVGNGSSRWADLNYYIPITGVDYEPFYRETHTWNIDNTGGTWLLQLDDVDFGDGGTADIIHVNVTGNPVKITGIQGGVDGRILMLYCSGNEFALALENYASYGTAENRIQAVYPNEGGVGGLDVSSKEQITLRYTSLYNRWEVIGRTAQKTLGYKQNGGLRLISENSVFMKFSGNSSTLDIYDGGVTYGVYMNANSFDLRFGNATPYLFSPAGNFADIYGYLDAGVYKLMARDSNNNSFQLTREYVNVDANQTIGGTKTFTSLITGSISGNAGTVTNGVYTTGTYADPAWITSLSASKIASGTFAGTYTFTNTITGSINGNAGTVTNGVYTTGDQTITGFKTFDDSINHGIALGASATSNGRIRFYSTGAYGTLSPDGTLSTNRTWYLPNADGTIITTGNLTDITGTLGISITGNAGTVTNGVYTTGSYANPAWITSLASNKISAGTFSGSFTFSSTLTASITGNAGSVTNGVYTNTDQSISGIKTFFGDIDSLGTYGGIVVGDSLSIIDGTIKFVGGSNGYGYLKIGSTGTTGRMWTLPNASGTVITTGNLSDITGTLGISITGNAGTVTNGVYTTGNQTIGGNKQFTGYFSIGTSSPSYIFSIYNGASSQNNWANIYANCGSAGGLPPSALNAGLLVGWNSSAGGGETQLLYGSALGGSPSMQFGSWDGSTKSILMTLDSTGLTLAGDISVPRLDLSIQQKYQLKGGGTITTTNTGGYNYIKWSSRFILIGNGGGSSQPYWQITCPTSGTITGANGHANMVATSNGIPLSAWDTLYYVIDYDITTTVSVQTNFRLVSYGTAGFDIITTQAYSF